MSVSVSDLADVKRLDVFFPPSIIDFTKPVTVAVNGRAVQVKARPDSRAFVAGWLLHPFFRKTDRSRVFTGGCTVVRDGRILDSPEVF